MQRLHFTALALIVPFALAAATLTPEQALERLGRPGSPMHARAAASSSPQLVRTAFCSDGEAAAYLFDKGERGFMIVSADESAEPLLAYSDSGSLSGDLPPQLQWWLEEYARQIEYNKEMGFASAPLRTAAPRQALEAIEPQIKTDWDQSEPYNALCPKVGTERTYTGCVATAMAQVMKYWEYPECGKGNISYSAETIQKRLSLNFTLRDFEWDKMIPMYLDGNYTEEQADAVAYLMKACGYAVKMDYGTDSSGALAMNISNALVRYFDYDPNIKYTLRQYYTTTEWSQLIYDNLKNVGPILYGGGSILGGGHSFICDGYDGNGYFHFNWGWTGMSNGYFSLDALNPYALGAGGGQGGGYNFTQDIVLGIQPPTGDPVITEPVVLTQTGSLAGFLRNDSLIFDLFAAQDAMWVNYHPETLYIKFGATFHNLDDASAEDFTLPVTSRTFMIQPGYGTSPELFCPAIDLNTAPIPDGRYTVTIVNSHEKTPDEWYPVKPNIGYFNYITFSKNGKLSKIENNDVDRLQVVSAEVINDLYYGCGAHIRITVGNGSDVEMSSGFAPAFICNGEFAMLGESILITVPPGETVTREWITPIYTLSQYFSISQDTQVLLTFFDENSYNLYNEDILKPVMMKANLGRPELESLNVRITNHAGIDLEFLDGKISSIMKVANPREIKVSSTVRLVSGYFGYELCAFAVQPPDETGQMAIETYAGEIRFIERKGAEEKFETTLSFPGAEPDKLYMVMMGYSYGNQLIGIAPATCYFRLAYSGVEDVALESSDIDFDGHTVTAKGSPVEIFSIQGLAVASGYESIDTSAIPAGIYIVHAGEKSKKIVIK